MGASAMERKDRDPERVFAEGFSDRFSR